MAPSVTWNGTDAEGAELLHVLQENCTCTRWTSGAVREMCAGHKALTTEQRFNDGLVYARRMRDCLRAEEMRAVDIREGNG